MWNYRQPTEISFGIGARQSLPEITARFGKRPILVTDAALAQFEMTARTLAALGPDAVLFAEVEPNPTVSSVDALAALIRETSRDVVVALGGGSSLDCAKAACAVAVQGNSIRSYHSEGAKLDGRHLPLIAMPTTAGTGSEVTPISVLDDPEKGIKAPLVHDSFFPKVALIDPELTLTLPRYVTACTGLDALAHAVEGYWSNNHQPICDVLAMEAARLVVASLSSVLTDGTDVIARESMCRAALLAGMAFQLPKNAAVHACSFPLSSQYHQPHGAACAMTLDHFIRYNAPAMGDRGAAFARAAGLESMDALADVVHDLKVQAGLPTRLSEIGVTGSSIDALVKASFHPLMNNNPREVTAGELKSLYMDML
jgi:alcohol dehydrogenase class IV